MNELIFAGQIPDKLKQKAFLVVSNPALRVGNGWKKINGLRDWFSCRLNDNYRLMRTFGGPYLVCNHDVYERKNKTLKRQEW